MKTCTIYSNCQAGVLETFLLHNPEFKRQYACTNYMIIHGFFSKPMTEEMKNQMRSTDLFIYVEIAPTSPTLNLHVNNGDLTQEEAKFYQTDYMSFGDLPQAAEVIYQGNLSIQFIRDVQEGKYPVIEGVVAKGEDFSVKIKTKSYFDKLFNNFGENWKNYAE